MREERKRAAQAAGQASSDEAGDRSSSNSSASPVADQTAPADAGVVTAYQADSTGAAATIAVTAMNHGRSGSKDGFESVSLDPISPRSFIIAAKRSSPSAISGAVSDRAVPTPSHEHSPLRGYPYGATSAAAWASATARNQAAYERLQKVNYTAQPMWRLGLGLVTIASLLDFIALIFAAQSIVAPLGSLTLVSNTVFAPLILGETVNRRDFAATICIMIGSILSISFADHEDSIYTLAELFSFFATARMCAYAITILLMLGFLFYAKRYVSIVKKRIHCENGGI